MNALYWQPDDALARLCSVEQVGTLRQSVALPEAQEGARPDAEGARRLAGFALLHLARLATGEGRQAVEACRLILERAYGPPAAAPSGAAAPEAFPEWVTARRLLYQEERGAHSGNGAQRDEVSTNGGDVAPVGTH